MDRERREEGGEEGWMGEGLRGQRKRKRARAERRKVAEGR